MDATEKSIKQDGKGQFWVLDAQDIHNNSSLVKITHNGRISVKCLNDSLQITILEKQFTVSVRPKAENSLRFVTQYVTCHVCARRGIKCFFKFRECFALDTVNICKTQLGSFFHLKKFNNKN